MKVIISMKRPGSTQYSSVSHMVEVSPADIGREDPSDYKSAVSVYEDLTRFALLQVSGSFVREGLMREDEFVEVNRAYINKEEK